MVLRQRCGYGEMLVGGNIELMKFSLQKVASSWDRILVLCLIMWAQASILHLRRMIWNQKCFTSELFRPLTWHQKLSDLGAAHIVGLWAQLKSTQILESSRTLPSGALLTVDSQVHPHSLSQIGGCIWQMELDCDKKQLGCTSQKFSCMHTSW